MAAERCPEHKLKIVRDARCVLCLARRTRRIRTGLAVLVVGLLVAFQLWTGQSTPAATTASHGAVQLTSDPADPDGREPAPLGSRGEGDGPALIQVERSLQTPVPADVAPAEGNAEDRYLGSSQVVRAPVSANGTRPPEPPRAGVDPAPWAADDPRDWDVAQRASLSGR